MSQVRRYAQIIGWGKYVPPTIVTNDDIAQIVETSDEWIRTRTGIRERRKAAEKESSATMAIRAAQQALDVAQVDVTSLGVIIVATATPDYLFPATACLVQDALGARQAGAFDLGAGCSGFVYALSVAADGIVAGSYDTALVIGSETLTRIVDWKDRGTCVLFGDGAGAVVLHASAAPDGILATVLGSDGSGGELLTLPGSGFKDPVTPESRSANMPYIQMNGNEVYRFATRTMGAVAQQALQKAGMTLDQVSLLIPHQANLRIIQSAAKQLKLPDEKVFVNLDRYGNTAAAAVPIALCEAVESGRLATGDIVVLAAFGAGLTWGAAVVRWQPLQREVKRSWWRSLLRWLRQRLAPVRSRARRVGRTVDTVVGEVTGDSEDVNKKPQEIKATQPPKTPEI
jgi:3-oxoacyl-[acyl-carrier-protein] synthase-3